LVVRKRIIALTVLTTTLALVLFGAPLAIGVARYYANDERAELERVADSAALMISSDVVHREPMRHFSKTDDVTSVGFYRADGTRSRGAGPVRLEPAAAAVPAGQVASADTASDLVVAVPIVDNGKVTGIVRAATTRNEVYRRTWLTWLVMLAFAVVALAATGLIARRQARRLALPLEQLSAAAARLGSGDFTVRHSDAGIPEIDSVFASLEVTAQRLNEVLTRERAFSADASHQLRTPLAGLRLQLESGLEARDSDLRASVLASIESADRLERTIDDLLTLARDSLHEGKLVPVAAELREIVGGRSAWFSSQQRDLIVTVQPVIAESRVSAPVLRQIVAVLLDNAAQHGAGAVTVTARDVGASALAVDVRDEGPGIDEDVDLFRRRQSPDEGHGIGLALARRLAEAEGGRLSLTHPRPATFTLLLPLRD
jgi:signal transduction histidine kinase